MTFFPAVCPPAEALADGAVKQGLPRHLAYRLAAQTMVGAGRMVLDTSAHPAVLKDEVRRKKGKERKESTRRDF